MHTNSCGPATHNSNVNNSNNIKSGINSPYGCLGSSSLHICGLYLSLNPQFSLTVAAFVTFVLTFH